MAALAERMPVTLLTGFLGSGKTTLLRRALDDPAFAATAILVNELGAVGLDHQLLRGAAETTRLLENGCVCCTVRDDLAATLAELYWDRLHRRVPRFERVVIETTGLADPGPVLRVLEQPGIAGERYRWAAVVCTVDGVAGERQILARPEPSRQAALADVLLLTKSDLAEAATIASLDARLRALNPVAPRYVVARGAAPAAALEALRGVAPAASRSGFDGPVSERPTKYVETRRIHASDIATFVVPLPPVSRAGLAIALERIARRHTGPLLRGKGAVRVVGEAAPVVVQIVHDIVYPLTTLAVPAGEGFEGSLVFIVAHPDLVHRRDLESDIRASLRDLGPVP